ncbi:MAG: response regulator, partial [Melioribacteraceae bacterium]|nr:response regulator [Melioribacteraceae bacterium]
MRILLIDSDLDSVDQIKPEIDRHYIVDVAYNGSEGTYLSQVNDYAAIIIESALPDIESREVCRITRSAKVKSPILMLLEEEDIDYKISSLDCGADAFLTKPINKRELLAYIRAFAKRNSDNASLSKLVVADLSLDMKTRV